MKKLFYSLLVLAMTATAFTSCEDVPAPYSDPNNNGGGITPTPSVEPKGNGTEASPYNVTAAIAKGTASNVYTKGFIVGYIYGKSAKDGARFSSDTCTVTSNVLIAATTTEKDLTKCMPIQLPAGTVRTTVNLKDNKVHLGKEVLLYGEITKFYGQPGVKSVTYAEIDGKTAGTKPGSNENAILNETFAASLGQFTIADEVDLAAGTTVWQADTKYKCAKASAYINKVRVASDSWIISPALDLSSVTKATLSFEQAGKFFGTVANEIKVLVSTDYNSGKPSTATWTPLTLSATITNADFTFVATTADLQAFVGKANVRIAFEYKSTTTTAGTWELKNLIVK